MVTKKRVVIFLVLVAAGFGAWKFYAKSLGDKSDGQLFEMISSGSAAGAAETELMLRASTGRITPATFREHMKDTSPKARVVACRGAKSLKDKAAAPQLIAMLEDPKEDAEVKEAAASAFANIRVKEAIPSLLKMLDYTSENVRVAASDALRSITKQKYSNKEGEKWKLWWTENASTFKVVE